MIYSLDVYSLDGANTVQTSLMSTVFVPVIVKKSSISRLSWYFVRAFSVAGRRGERFSFVSTLVEFGIQKSVLFYGKLNKEFMFFCKFQLYVIQTGVRANMHAMPLNLFKIWQY